MKKKKYSMISFKVYVYSRPANGLKRQRQRAVTAAVTADAAASAVWPIASAACHCRVAGLANCPGFFFCISLNN